MKTKLTSAKKGSVLMTANPFVYVLLGKNQGLLCDNCLKRTRVLKCGRCHFVHYCGRACQAKSWTEHKDECKGMKKISPRTLPDAARMMIKLIIKLKKGGDLEKVNITETWSRRFRDLMSHYSDVKQDLQRLEHFESLQHILSEFFDVEDVLPNPVEMMGIYGRLCVNGFNILDGEMSCIGAGIYLGPSIIDHSCRPNAVATFDGLTLQLRALEDMPKFDWTKVRISYVDLLSFRSDRREELKKAYYFMCDCERCVIDKDVGAYLNEEAFSSSLACPHFGCGTAIIMQRKNESNLDPCKTCGHNLTEDEMKNYWETEELTLEKMQLMGSTAYLDVCKVLLKRQEDAYFHPLNLLHVKTLDMTFESAIQMQCWEDALIYGRQLIPGFRQYHGQVHPLVGLLHLKLAKVATLLERPQAEVRDLVKHAAKVLQVTHGMDHPLVKAELAPLIQEVIDTY